MLFPKKTVEKAEGHLFRSEATAKCPAVRKECLDSRPKGTAESRPLRLHTTSSPSPQATSRSVCRATLL